VAPQDTLAGLASECDELICLAAPDPFRSVGSHYADFEQTSDEEVKRLLAEARRSVPAHAAA
jgi:putative phosphoribosyl transferase